MDKSQLVTLREKYTGQRIFFSKEKGYNFDLLDDIWKIGYKKSLYLGWLNKLEIDSATFLDLRLAIAHAVPHYSFNSLNSHLSTLKTIVNYCDPLEFIAWWLTLDNYKTQIKNALYAFCYRSKDYYCTTLSPLFDEIKNENLGRNGGISRILDIDKGAYSEIEHANLLEVLRIETHQALNAHKLTQKSFTRLRNAIACQLMVAIVRRPTQLVKMKWCDVLRVGQQFESHNEPDRDWRPFTQHLFSDVEQLHLRTFKGKDGSFRFNAESRSHRLEPETSLLLLNYYQAYKNYLIHQLINKNLNLSSMEMEELMGRLPILPDQSLFSSDYHSKAHIFSAVSHLSEAYHLSSVSLHRNINYLFKRKLNAQSDRIPNTPLALSNNRWRHTQLTQAAWQGLSPAQIASITGVTIQAIVPYIDLKAKDRVKIDQAYANNQIIKRFDTISVKKLQEDKEFCIKSPFDEEIGYQLTPENCSSCKSKGAAPMGCYPCDNFRPLDTANHQQYLNKAKRKLEINKKSGHHATVKRLYKIIMYIEATISQCEERNTPKLREEK
ncbi:hypothetical protein AB6D86_24150 [Vibrio splendidus]